MSHIAAHTAAFRREVPGEGRVYAIRDSGGYPAPKDPDGNRAMPFWSKWSRARRVVVQAAAYREFDIVEVPVAEWIERWLPGLERDGLRVGINWTGSGATGYDLEPAQVRAWFTGDTDAPGDGVPRDGVPRDEMPGGEMPRT